MLADDSGALFPVTILARQLITKIPAFKSPVAPRFDA